MTFAVAWAFWIAGASVAKGTSAGPGTRALFFLPGTFAPALVAIGLAARAGGSAAVNALFDRIFDASAAARWYVFAAGYMAAVKLVAAAVHRALTGEWPAFGQTPFYLLLVATAFSTPFQAGEEIGWRGFALPRMAKRFGLGGAGVLLGVVWALWHLPLFLLPGTDTTGQSFPVFLISVTALSVAMAWLFGNTGGRLLPVMLMHAAINNTKDIVPSAVPGASRAFTPSPSLIAWLSATVLWTGAAYFLVKMPRDGGSDRASRPAAG